MNRSLLVMSVCILLLTGVCFLAAQEKKSPPPPTNQPEAKKEVGDIIGKQALPPGNPETPKKQPPPPPANQPAPKGPPGPPANVAGPKKPIVFTPPPQLAPTNRPGHQCVGITAVVKGPEGRETIVLYRAWDDGVVEVSTTSPTPLGTTNWARYEPSVPKNKP